MWADFACRWAPYCFPANRVTSIVNSLRATPNGFDSWIITAYNCMQFLGTYVRSLSSKREWENVEIVYNRI